MIKRKTDYVLSLVICFIMFPILRVIKKWGFYVKVHSSSECIASFVERKMPSRKNSFLTSQDSIRLQERVVKTSLVLMPFKTTCIQRSLMMKLLLAIHGVSCDFMLGSRRLPFMMHCWLERNGDVIFDSPKEQHIFNKRAIKPFKRLTNAS